MGSVVGVWEAEVGGFTDMVAASMEVAVSSAASAACFWESAVLIARSAPRVKCTSALLVAW
jgi:hypothetical protein